MKAFLFSVIFLIPAAFLQAQDNFLVSAHRGYSSIAPENTLSAFQKAIDIGADFYELDVRRSADDSLILMHDRTIDRTTNGTGALSGKTYEELQMLEASYSSRFGNEYAGEPIPTLYEALSLTKGKIKVEIEIKEAGIAADVVELVQQLEIEDEVIIISFNFNEIAAAKQADPSIPVKFLVGSNWGINEINRIVNIGGEYIGPSGVPSVNLVELAHQNEVGVICYTINSPSQIQQAIDNGLDGIATDYPGRAIAIREGGYVPEQSLLGHWIFNDTTDSQVKDLSGLENHLNIAGSPEFVPFGEDSAVYFDGNEDYFPVTGSRGISAPGSEVSIAAWIKPEALPADLPGSYSTVYGSDDDFFEMYLDKGNNELRFKVTTDQGPQRPGIPADSLTIDEWVLVTGTYDGTSAKIYLNDQLIDEHPLTGKVSGGQAAFIGKNGISGTDLFQGAIREVRVYNYGLEEQMIERLLMPDTMIAWWAMENTTGDLISDETRFNHDAEVYGGPEPVEWGGRNAIAFDGIDDYMKVSQSEVLNNVGDAVTISAWVKLNQLPKDISGSWGGVYDSDEDYYVLYTDKGTNEFRMKVTTDQGAERPGIPGEYLELNKWMHVAGIYDGHAARVYLNGLLMDEHLISGNIIPGQVPFIGRNGTASGFFDGAIADLKIYNYALPVDSLPALPVAKDTIARWLMNDTIQGQVKDEIRFRQHASVQGDPEIIEGKEGPALLFDGEQDYLEVPSSEFLENMNEGLTITAWIKLAELPSEISDSWMPVYDSDEDYYVLYLDKANNELRFKITTDEKAEKLGIPGGSLHKDRWMMVSAVYDGSSAKIYLDGMLMDEHEISGNILDGQTAFIGKNGTVNSYFHGGLDEVTIYNYPLSETEIRNQATPKLLIAHWDMVPHEEEVEDLTEFNSTATMHGAPSVVARGGESALSFDGSEDYLEIEESDMLLNPGSQLTISAWVKLNDLPSEISDNFDPVLDSYGDTYSLYTDQRNNEFRFKVTTTGGAERPGIPGDQLATNKWIHIVGVYDGSSAKIYLNGQLKDEHPLTGLINQGQEVSIGKSVGDVQLFNGDIGEIKIYNYALSMSEIELMAIPSDLIAHWDFNDATQVTDLSGYDHHLTTNGNPSVVFLNDGEAMDFDGVDDFLEVPQSTLLNHVGSSLTITARVKFNDHNSQISDSYEPVFDSNEDIYVIYGDKRNSELRFKVTTTDGAERPGISDDKIPAGQWVDIAGVYDGTSAKIYLNGLLQDEHFITGDILSAGQFAAIGRNGQNSEHLNGEIEEIRIYNFALTEDSILALTNPIVTSVNVKKEEESHLRVYPNPAGNAHITVTGTETGGQITVSNMNGQLIFSDSISSDGRVNFGTKPEPGIYMLEYTSPTGKRRIERLVIQ